MHNIFHYYSSGHVLLTGEYLVSQGTEVIALPIKKGQTLAIEPITKDNLIWESIYNEKKYFEAVFTTDELRTLKSTAEEKAIFVQSILKKAMDYLPSLDYLPGYFIKALHNHPASMDIGNKSVLIANIAEWFNINPFRLNREIRNERGYGIACAKSNKPILYKLSNKYPEYREININLPFSENIYFVYTGHNRGSSNKKKQIQKHPDLHNVSHEIKEINKRIIKSDTSEAFEKALLDHDKLLSGVLNEKRLQEKTFQDFPGIIKPLNEWNGEFILVTWQGDKGELQEYFASYKIQSIFSWDELIKNSVK